MRLTKKKFIFIVNLGNAEKVRSRGELPSMLNLHERKFSRIFFLSEDRSVPDNIGKMKKDMEAYAVYKEHINELE